jgi:hypothetical protein
MYEHEAPPDRAAEHAHDRNDSHLPCKGAPGLRFGGARRRRGHPNHDIAIAQADISDG